MSRAINLNVALAGVAAMCDRHEIEISAIEPLMCGGTRVVLNNADDTAVIARAFKSNIIAGPVRRVSISSSRR